MDAAWKPLGLKVHAMLDQGMTKIHHQICVSAVMVMDFSKIGWLDTKAFFLYSLIRNSTSQGEAI